MLLDNNKNRDELIAELDRLEAVVSEEQTRYQIYKGYQKSYKVFYKFYSILSRLIRMNS